LLENIIFYIEEVNFHSNNILFELEIMPINLV